MMQFNICNKLTTEIIIIAYLEMPSLVPTANF